MRRIHLGSAAVSRARKLVNESPPPRLAESFGVAAAVTKAITAARKAEAHGFLPAKEILAC